MKKIGSRHYLSNKKASMQFIALSESDMAQHCLVKYSDRDRIKLK